MNSSAASNPRVTSTDASKFVTLRLDASPYDDGVRICSACCAHACFP